MRKTKKMFALSLAAVLAASGVLAGCGSTKEAAKALRRMQAQRRVA